MRCIRRGAFASFALFLIPFSIHAQPLPGSDPTVGSQAAPQSLDANGTAPSAASDGRKSVSETGAPSQPSYVLPGSRQLDSLLGMTLAEAFREFGPPEEVFPVRGQQAWEDDVVFYYPDHTYLFWFRNRVWQVRADRRYASEALGVRMGEGESSVNAKLGPPFWSDTASEIFNIADLASRGFPIRARLFFTDGKLSDLYIYRADF